MLRQPCWEGRGCPWRAVQSTRPSFSGQTRWRNRYYSDPGLRNLPLNNVRHPMRLLRLQHVEIGPRDRIFRHPRMRALIVWLAGFAATAAFFFNAYTRKWPPGYFFGSFLLLFVL